jgi:hypothetical protein
VQESRDILYLFQNLCIVGHLNKLDKLIKDLFNILELSSVGIYQLLLVHQTLLFALVLPFKANYDVLLFLLEFANQLTEAILNVTNLNFHQSLELVTDLPHKHRVFIN